MTHSSTDPAGKPTVSSAHTPGPWHTGGTFNPGTARETQNVWGPRTNPDYQSGPLVCQNARPADARLIAAAPELLDALRGLFAGGFIEAGIREHSDWASELAYRLISCRAAIAKAEGRL